MPVPTLTPQSPSVGRIAWSAFSIQYGGVAYAVGASNTDKRFTFWRYNGGSPALEASDFLPDGLIRNDFLENSSFQLVHPTDETMPLEWQRGDPVTVGRGTATGNSFRIVDPDNPGSYALQMQTSAYVSQNASSSAIAAESFWSVTPGEIVYAQVDLETTAATPKVYLRLDPMEGAGSDNIQTTVTGHYVSGENQTIPAGRSIRTMQFTIPAGVTGVRPYALLYSTDSSDDGKSLLIRSFKLSKSPIEQALTADDLLLFLNKNGVPVNAQAASVLDGSLIVSESILANAIGANQITSPHILAGAVDATHVKAGAIQTNHIESGAVTANEIDVNVLRSGFTITGAIQVGTHTWTPNEGFIIPGVVVLPGMAGGVAQFTGNITALGLTVQKDLNLLGDTNKIAGTLTLANGITRPTGTPSVYQSWEHVGSKDMSFGPIHYGLCSHNGDATLLLSTESFFGGAIVSTIKSSGAGWVAMANGSQYGPGFESTYKAYLDNFHPSGGITTLDGDYYILGQDSNRSSNWYIYRLNSSFNKVSEALLGYTPVGRPAIGNDGTNIIVGMAVTPNTLRVYSWNTSLAFQGGVNWTTFTGIGNSNISSINAANFDFGAHRYVTAIESNANFVCTNTGDRLSDVYNFPRANGHVSRGLWWDGTRFWSLGTDGSLYKHGTNIQSQAITASHTWYDGDSTGGTHETEETTVPATGFTRQPRTFLNITTNEAPDSGVTDAGQTDKANRVGVYVGVGGGSRRLQIHNGVDGEGRSIRDTILDTIATGSATPPATNGFAGADNSPGIFKSFDASGTQGFILNGDGSGNWGELAVDVAGDVTLDSDTDWANLTHAASSGTLRWRCQNKTVWMEGNLTFPSTATNTNREILTAANAMPAAYRPNQSLWSGIGRVNAGTLLAHVVPFTDGSVTIANQCGAAATTIQFRICWPLES